MNRIVYVVVLASCSALFACGKSADSSDAAAADTIVEMPGLADVAELRADTFELRFDEGPSDEGAAALPETTDIAMQADPVIQGDSADAKELNQLSVLTFNLHCHHDEPEKRLAMVVDTAVEWGVRVFALQEVCEGGGLENTAKTLAGLMDDATGLQHSALFTPTHTAWDTYQEGLGLVFAGQMTHSEASDLPPGLFPRKALWARVVDGGEIYDVVVTHLSFGDEQADVRLAQAQALEELLVEKILPDAPGPVILAGDFNAPPSSQPVELFTAEGWTEAFHRLHPDDPGYTYPSGNAKSKIDYVFLLDGSYETVLLSDVVLNQPVGGLYPSDHYGIAATFSY